MSHTYPAREGLARVDGFELCHGRISNFAGILWIWVSTSVKAFQSITHCPIEFESQDTLLWFQWFTVAELDLGRALLGAKTHVRRLYTHE